VTIPWLSVIIPCHNGERWLTATLQSIVDQKDGGLEVILVDSSSNDLCLRIVESFRGVLKVRAIRRPDLLSWTAKTNFGATLGRGEHICILHQDDTWLSERSVAVRKWVSNQSDGVMYLHPCYIIDETGRRLGLWRCPLPAGCSPLPAQLLYQRLLIQNFIGIPTPTIRRDAYFKVGGLDESLWYTADWDLYLKIAGIGPVYYHCDPLACFRVHKRSLTVVGSRNIEDFRQQHQIIIERHIQNIISDKRTGIKRVAETSVGVNVALASAIAGKLGGLTKAACSVLALGPNGIRQYVFCSRIADRVIPRLRALITGTF